MPCKRYGKAPPVHPEITNTCKKFCVVAKNGLTARRRKEGMSKLSAKPEPTVPAAAPLHLGNALRNHVQEFTLIMLVHSVGKYF